MNIKKMLKEIILEIVIIATCYDHIIDLEDHPTKLCG